MKELRLEELDIVLNEFVAESKNILGDNLSGIYLHGSAVMGCFNPKSSDIDLLIVVKDDIPNHLKAKYLDMVVRMNDDAPAKGIEMSIVKECVCNPFVYPTPFELHFSIMHLNWYLTNPKDYIEKMKGNDIDLAAHFTIICNRGKCLYGKPIDEVFGKIDSEFYFDSIWKDVSEAADDIMENTMYIILNLCRVLAYKKQALVYSKLEGGNWGIKNLPQKYHKLIEDALKEYTEDITMQADEFVLKEYAAYMITQIGGDN